MQKSNFVPKATVLLQFQAGVEVEAVVVDGTMYVPLVTLPVLSKESETPEETIKNPAHIEASGGKPELKVYTSDQLLEMDADVIAKMIKEAGGNPDEGGTKKTNKKMRLMYLEMLEKHGSAEESEESEESDDEFVSIESLKVDDEVEVWWENMKAWFKGTVCQVKGGKVVVHYEDDAKEVLVAEIHTKIKLIQPV